MKTKFEFGGRTMFVILFWIVLFVYFATEKQVWINVLFTLTGIKLIMDWFGNEGDERQ